MIKVYVAGAYSADNVMEVLQNIGRGQHFAAEVFKMGCAPFCPWHDKEYVIHNYDSEFSVEKFYDYSMVWLEASDVLFLVPGWENSKGTQMEIERAKELGMTIIDTLTVLHQYKLNKELAGEA